MTGWDAAGLTREYWVQHALDVRIRLAAAPYMDGWDYDFSTPAVLYDLPDAMRASSLTQPQH